MGGSCGRSEESRGRRVLEGVQCGVLELQLSSRSVPSSSSAVSRVHRFTFPARRHPFNWIQFCGYFYLLTIFILSFSFPFSRCLVLSIFAIYRHAVSPYLLWSMIVQPVPRSCYFSLLSSSCLFSISFSIFITSKRYPFAYKGSNTLFLSAYYIERTHDIFISRQLSYT
jgi:hypothetical protein